MSNNADALPCETLSSSQHFGIVGEICIKYGRDLYSIMFRVLSVLRSGDFEKLRRATVEEVRNFIK